MKLKTPILLSLLLIIFTSKLYSQYYHDVRSLSMGNTSVANSYDMDAFNTNPANILKERGNNRASLYFNILTNFGFLMSSNYFSFDFYNKYFTSNSTNNPVILSEQDKQNILNKAGNEPINLNASVKTLGVVLNTKRTGSFGISLDDRFSGNFKVSKDFLELGLFGNILNRTYNFSDVSIDGTWVRQLNFTYANNISVKKSKLFKVLSYGVSVKPQFGLYYLSTEKNNLSIFTEQNFQIRGTGTIELIYSGVSNENRIQFSLNPAGFGFGFDAGINATLRNVSKRGQLNIGLSVNDIGYISWSKNNYRYFYNGNYVITDITDQKQIDSLNNIIKGTKTAIPSFTTGLPLNIRAGLSYKIFSKAKADSLNLPGLEMVNLSLEYIQGLTDKFGASKTPAVGFGAEYNITKVFSTRLGLVVGGREKFIAGFGLGIDTGPVIIDLGTYNVESLINPKGTSKIAGGLSIKFKVN